MVIFFLLLGALQLFAQESKIMIANETSYTFDELMVKVSDEGEWEENELNEGDLTESPSFLISLQDLADCVIDIRARSGSTVLTWSDIDVCKAGDVSLFVDEQGETFFQVKYLEEYPDEEEEEDEDPEPNQIKQTQINRN